MRRVLISLFWNPARTARSCWYPEGEIVKSDKSPSQIRDRKFRIGRMVVQLQISDLGFKMQDSSDFKIPSHRCSVSQVCRSPLRGGECCARFGLILNAQRKKATEAVSERHPRRPIHHDPPRQWLLTGPLPLGVECEG